MSAPTPTVGMHPTLEQPGYFPDLHTSLSVEIRYHLAPQLPTGYTVSVERGVSMTGEGGEPVRLRPDVRIDRGAPPRGGSAATAVGTATVDAPAFDIGVPSQPQRYVAIRGEGGELITTIEVLSPSNKSGDGYEDFRLKQERLAARGVHLVEVDLLRAGRRRWRDERVDEADYVCTLRRAGAERVKVWCAEGGRALPTIPVPLRAPDADVALALEPVMQEYLTKSGLGTRL